MAHGWLDVCRARLLRWYLFVRLVSLVQQDADYFADDMGIFLYFRKKHSICTRDASIGLLLQDTIIRFL